MCLSYECNEKCVYFVRDKKLGIDKKCKLVGSALMNKKKKNTCLFYKERG